MFNVNNSQVVLEIDFFQVDTNILDYQIVSQQSFASVTDSAKNYEKALKKDKGLLAEFLSQPNLKKYLSIIQKQKTIEERLFLPGFNNYLSVKIIPQSDNKAKFILNFSEEDDNFPEVENSVLEKFDSLPKNSSDSIPIANEKKKEFFTVPSSNKTLGNKASGSLDQENTSLFKLTDLIDTNELNKLMLIFYKFTKAPVIIVDLEGEILASIGMTEICTKFHRRNEISQKRCIESDIHLTKDLIKDEIRFYKCLNNMYDLVSPIYVEDRHVANFFVGEFFFADEEPDYKFFTEQAKKLNFNIDDYLAALDKVPRIERDEVMRIISFYRDLLKIITTLAHSRLKLLEMNHQIEQREEKLQQITDNMTDVVFTADFDFNILYISPSIEKLTGYTPDEYKKLSMEARYPPLAISEICDSIRSELTQDLTTGDKKRSNVNELALFDKQNKIVLTSIHSKFLRNMNDEPIGIIANIRNISNQKKAEREIVKQLNLQYLISTIAGKYINISTANIDESLNGSLKQIATFLGADRSYIFKYDWENQTCSNTHEWVAKGITPEIDNLQNIPLEDMDYWTQNHREGKTIYIHDVENFTDHPKLQEILNSQNIKSLITIPLMKNNECTGFIGIDSVMQKHLYSKTKQTILTIFAELLVNIDNRIDLENELRTEREKALNSDTLKSNLLKNISHEFRTPLNGIVGFSDLLQQNSCDSEQGNMASMIYSSAIRLNFVLDSIMLLNQLEDINNKKSISLKTVNISRILTDIVSLFKEQFKNNNLILSSEIETNLYGAVDEKLLYQAFIHLLNNALKFTHKGKVEVHCYSQDGKILVEIIDSGIGIPQESLKIIFAEFRQASEGFNRAYEGVGLGLTISKKIFDLMNGEIKVRSKILEGSTFTVTLPLISISESKLSEIEKIQEETSFKIETEKPKILIVEDNTINQKLIISILKNYFSTDLAISGEVAILLAEKTRYDAILMDIHLGEGIDGLTAAKTIKSNHNNTHTPIIAITGYTMYGDKEKILHEGCDYYLGKPYKKSELLSVISTAIS